MSVFDRLFGRARRVTEDNATVELPRPQGPALRVGNVQGVGARERQEDSFAVCNVSDPEALERAGLFAVVADGMGGMDMNMFAADQTLTLNANNELVKYIFEHKDSENVPMFCEQLYDLAVLSNHPLSVDEMTKFVERSNKIMMLLAK